MRTPLINSLTAKEAVMTENRNDRLARLFDGLREKGEGAFVPFVNLCDPDAVTSEAVIEALIAGGADALELGIPFSDPCADGPVIQASAVRALASGATTAGCFEVLARIRAKHPDIPVGLLVYINLVTAPGVEVFFKKAAEAGADAVLIADLPIAMREAEPEWDRAAQAAGLHLIAIAPPELDDARAEVIAQRSTGYVYLLGRAGITGTDKKGRLSQSVVKKLRDRKAAPLLLGFGISTPDDVAAAVAGGADGVIAGSAVVQIVNRYLGDVPAMTRELTDYVRRMKAATRQ